MSGTNGWTKNVESLLKNWSQQISINENQYRKRGTFYRNWYYAFGVFIIVSQTGALTSLVNAIVSINNNEESDGISTSDMAVLIFVAIMETLILVAQGVDKFFNFGAGSEQYYEAAKEHNTLSRLIDSTLTLARADRDTAREVLLSIQQQFNQLQNNSPNLPPDAVVHRLDMCIYEDPSQAKGKPGIQVGAGAGMLVKELTFTELPANTKPVDLPGSPPGEDKLDPDEEQISNALQHKIGVKLGEEKKKAARESVQKRGIFKALEYQWNRMEQHGDDLYSQEVSSSSEYSV